MKIRGRYIAVLAVLGLLLALVPLAPAGAAVGDLTVTGGADGEGVFFSDKDNYNIIEIAVQDADLSPARVGTARYTGFAASSTVNLNDGVVAGELNKTEKFDGGLKNPICIDSEAALADGTAGKGILDRPWDPSIDTGEMPEACAPQGDVVLGPGADTDYVDNDASNDPDGVDETADNTYTITLKETLRDANDDGVVTSDDVTVNLDNSELAVSSGFILGTALPNLGKGVDTILLSTMPRDPNADSVDDENLVIDYEYSEYEFAATTPIRISGTTISAGAAATGFAGAIDEYTINTSNSSTATMMTISGVTAGSHVVVTFVYNVQDTESDFVTVSSGTSQARNENRVLDGKESASTTSLFESSVLLVTYDDFTTIAAVATDPETYAGDSETVFVSELTASNLDNNTDLADRIADAVLELDDITTGSKATDLVARLLPVSHGDTVSVNYRDASQTTNRVKTAEVDLEAPVVSLIGPANGSFTSERVVSMEAEVVDEGAGVDRDTLTVIASSGVNIEDSVPRSIADGVGLTRVPTSLLDEGKKEWAVIVQDRVGNTPAINDPGTDDENEATLGAAGPDVTSIDFVGKPFSYAVDTSSPTLVNGKTGVRLANVGVTTGDASDQEEESGTRNREWLRVTFDAGDGTAPLDPATVAPGDFRVDGVEPSEAIVSSKQHGEVAKGLAVYLRVPMLATDATPKVEITDDISDRASNVRSGGSLDSIMDGLSPVLEVTPSSNLSDDEIVISITSSESIRGFPEVLVTTTEPDGENTAQLAGREPPVRRDIGSFTSWTAIVENPTPQRPNRYYIVVDASDAAGNDVTLGDASNEDDLYSVQFDASEPSLTFTAASGKALDTTVAADKPEEGAVWIVAEFDEDEHVGDKYRKVTVTGLSLTNLDTEEEIANDDAVALLFVDEVDCVDHDTSSTRYDAADANNKCATYTLAIDLTPGMYNIEVAGMDSLDNPVMEDVDFEVIEATPFELTLRPGQNFISLPGMPMDEGGNIDTLFSDEAISAVSTYDRSRELAGENPWLRSSKDLETGMFSGDITAIEPGKAYFVNSTASVVVEVKLQATGQLPPTIPVRQGFNAIGFWSVTGDDEAEIDLYLGSIGWSVAYSYDPTPGRGWEVIRKGDTDPITFLGEKIEAGKGYLVYALYDSVLTP